MCWSDYAGVAGNSTQTLWGHMRPTLSQKSTSRTGHSDYILSGGWVGKLQRLWVCHSPKCRAGRYFVPQLAVELAETAFYHRDQALAESQNHLSRHLMQWSFECEKCQPVNGRPREILRTFAILFAEQAALLHVIQG